MACHGMYFFPSSTLAARRFRRRQRRVREKCQWLRQRRVQGQRRSPIRIAVARLHASLHAQIRDAAILPQRVQRRSRSGQQMDQLTIYSFHQQEKLARRPRRRHTHCRRTLPRRPHRHGSHRRLAARIVVHGMDIQPSTSKRRILPRQTSRHRLAPRSGMVRTKSHRLRRLIQLGQLAICRRRRE